MARISFEMPDEYSKTFFNWFLGDGFTSGLIRFKELEMLCVTSVICDKEGFTFILEEYGDGSVNL